MCTFNSARAAALAALLMLAVAPTALAQSRIKDPRYAAMPAHALLEVNASDLHPARKTGRVIVSLPGGGSLRVLPERIEHHAGVTSYFADSAAGRLTLTTDGKHAFGFLQRGAEQFVIDTVEGRTVVVDAASIPSPWGGQRVAMQDDAIVDEAQINALLAQTEQRRAALTAEDAVYSNVDIAIFYEASVAERESHQGARARAQAAVDYINAAYRTNEINMTLRLVYVGEFPGALPFDPFNTFVSNSQVAQIASQFGADLAHLLFDYRQGLNYCGLAFLFGRQGVSGIGCHIDSHVVAHETGHNFGAHHDRANASGSPNLPVSGYNYGYVCGGRGTVMSYPGYPHLPHYSSPDLTNGGEACGVEQGQPTSADNGRAVEVMRVNVETFAAEQPTYGTVRLEAPATLTINEENVQEATLRVVRDGDLTRAATVEIGSIEGEAVEGEDYEPILQRLTFAANQTERTVTLTILNDEDYEQVETLRVALRYPNFLRVAGDPVTFSITSGDPNRGRALFDAANVSIWESAGAHRVLVNRVDSSEGTLVVNYATVDGTARAGTDYAAASGQLTFGPGETSRTIEIQINDDQDYQGYNAVRSFNVRLTGANLGATRTHAVAIFNEDWRAGRLQFTAADYPVSENGGSIAARVERVEAAEGPISYTVETIDDTALAGRDYSYVQYIGSLPNDFTGPINFPVTVINNERFDGVRRLRVRITSPSMSEAAEATISIANEDPNRGLAQFAGAQVDVNEGAGALELQVARVQGAEDTLQVSYATVDGNARAGVDYAPSAGSLTFAPGETTRTISIPILNDDDVYDPGLSFGVRLTGALLGAPAETTVAIQNNDPNRGRAEFATTTVTVAENAGSATLQLRRLEAAEGELVVDYATADGAARDGVDYRAASGRVTFAAGDTTKSIQVPLIDNSQIDANRAFTVNLTGARLGAATQATVSIENDDRPAPPSNGGSGGGGGGAVSLSTLALALSLELLRRRQRAIETQRPVRT